MVSIHHPKDAAKLAETYRNLARKSPVVSSPKEKISAEDQDARNTEGLIKLAVALGDEKAAKKIRQRTTAASVLKRVKSRKKGKSGQG